MNQVVENKEDEVIQWVTFRLDGEIYGINVMQVQEVLRVTEIAPVPGAPDYVMGIINLRGNVVTVIETRKRFGLQSGEIDDSSRIVISEADGNVVGILVDSVAEVVDLKRSEIESSPNVGNEESSKYIEGVATHNDNLLILVDVNKLLSTEEWADLSAMQVTSSNDMADVPDINPLRPVWPTRPDEKTVRRKRRTEDGNSEEKKHKKENDENKGNAGDGHLDEYV